MTTLQKALVATVLSAAIATAIYQAVQNSKLRRQVQTLQQKQASLAVQLQHERDQVLEAQNVPLKSNQGELLQLRGEVARLRDAASRAARAEAELAQLKAALQGSAATATGNTNPTSMALAAYLGEPVPPPPNLDPAYSTEGLRNAIQRAAQLAGVPLKKVEIESSEFPFLVGIVYDTGADFQESASARERTKADLEKFTAQFKNMPGYEYKGSSGGAGTYAYNITPYDRLVPSDARERIERRNILRLQMFSKQLDAR
jgi:hypothetical protein